ncbi:hypothetical protein TPA2_gp76 [Tsukamurella phage TPA2]|uniref:hypothetical protein n=1 Tax=Tsukamurella phage TPA2 TaxID=981330 RepID=UPI0001FF8DE3|nr:hypothetical protein TPA2_gp76 [Tsukamurella phage TPA2]ADX31990.1 hypothetical protein [Tsukamurella phage TPA2]
MLGLVSDAPQAERWEPDEQLIACAMNGGRTMKDLAPPDRSWAVAGMTLKGLTADDIADRLGCSLRLVRSIRAEPMTVLATLYLSETDHFTDELRLRDSELRGVRADLSEALTEAARTRDKLGRLLDAHMVGAIDTCHRGHPMTEYNTYRLTGGDGRARRYCRECHRERQAARRKTEKAPTP